MSMESSLCVLVSLCLRCGKLLNKVHFLYDKVNFMYTFSNGAIGSNVVSTRCLHFFSLQKGPAYVMC